VIEHAATNEFVAEARSAGIEVTTFRADGDPQTVLVSVLDEVELHRGTATRRVSSTPGRCAV
jgi:hypothetical protein